MTKFEWISDRQVVATDIDENGVVTIIAAEVQPDGAFTIVDMYELPAMVAA